MPDSFGYLSYSDFILNTPNWYEKTEHLFRMVGYPYLISLLKILAGENWDFLLWLSQTLYSLFTTYLIYLSSRALFNSVKAAVLIACLYSFSIFLFLDNAILTDSFSGHSISAIFALLTLTYAQKKYKAYYFFAAGLLSLTSFLVREGSFFLLAAFVPILLYLFVNGLKYRSKAYMTVCLILFIVPTILGKMAMESWNEERTGHRFVTTGAQTVYLYALVGPAVSAFPEIFSSDNEFDKAFREKVTSTYFSETTALIQHMKDEFGWSAFDIIDYSKGKYLQSVTSNPLIPLYIMGSNLKPNTFVSFFQPTLAIAQIISRSEDNFKYWRARFLLKSLITDKNYNAFLPLILMSLETALTIAIFAIFLFLGPYHTIKEIREKKLISFVFSQSGFIFCLALGFIGIWMIHALVHLEARYHSGANICVLISAVFLIKAYPKITRHKLVKLFN